MRIILSVLLMHLLLPTVIAGNPVKLTCIVDSVNTQTSQWVYWFSLKENEYEIVDSCFLDKSQIVFNMQHNFEDDNFASWLLFVKSGKQLELVLTPGENVTINIQSSAFIYPNARGSIGTMEQYEFGIQIKQIRKKMEKLETLLTTDLSDSQQKYILDSIAYYKRELSPNIYLDFLLKTQSGANFASVLDFMSSTGMISRNLIDSLENVMLKRFPNSKSVERYFDPSPAPPATEHSKQVFNKYNYLIGRHIPKTPQKKDGFGTSGKGEYTIGTKVADIILDGIDGEKQRLSDVKSKYILIDFWASWCAPCCRAYPDLLKVQEKHPKNLCIYAISIDDNQGAWQNAVARLDPKHLLIHVRAIAGSEEGKALDKQYGILAIPTNFLLDEERKVVAINLLGDELEKKLSQIIEAQD